mgnify:CR=1 FL=1
MKKTVFRLCVSIFLVAPALGLGIRSAAAAAQCPELVSVPWWNDIDHKNMTLYVNTRHDGDWDAYVSRWQGHLNMVRKVYDRGGAVTSKKLNMRIEGRQLKEYIIALEARLAVTRCLADAEMAAAAKVLEGLETASGGEDPMPETVR